MRIKFLPAILIALSILIIASCSQTAGETKITVDLTKAKAEIQALEDGYAAAEKNKDAAGVAAYYSEDAISYNRGEEPSIGKAAITSRLEKRLAADTSGDTNVYKVVDLFADGDLLVEVGSWTSTSPAGKETNRGHYISVFEKRDGKYVCVRDMSVSSNPDKPVAVAPVQ